MIDRFMVIGCIEKDMTHNEPILQEEIDNPFTKSYSAQRFSLKEVLEFAAPPDISILNHKLKNIHKQTNQIQIERSEETQRMIFDDLKDFKIYEFTLQNLKTFETSFFTSLFFYEPYVTNLNIDEKKTSVDYGVHIFNEFFPKRKIFFYPKMIVVQSSKPYFSLQKEFLKLYYNIVLQPYLTCSKPKRISFYKHNLYTSKKVTSVVKHKEFFVSLLFSLKFNYTYPTVYDIKIFHYQLFVDIVRYQDYNLERSNFDLIKKYTSSKELLKKLILIYFFLVLEKKVYIVHENPSEFVQLLLNLIIPLWVK